MVLLAFVAADHQAANALVGQQSLIDREIGQVGLDSDALLRVQWLAGLDRVERSGRITWVVGERVRRQTRRQVITHGSTLRSGAGIAPAVHTVVVGVLVSDLKISRAEGGVNQITWVRADKMDI
jgi:hypothetical protein